jgi:hypothetical protein
MGLHIVDDSFESPIEALDFFSNPENQFYPTCSLSFPRITDDELLSLTTGEKKVYFFREGLDIFGSDGVFIQRAKPGIPSGHDEQLDLTNDSNSAPVGLFTENLETECVYLPS